MAMLVRIMRWRGDLLTSGDIRNVAAIDLMQAVAQAHRRNALWCPLRPDIEPE
jgi:hypothetical protein